MEEALDAWIFTRGETMELLSALSDEQLQFTPNGDKWQPLYYQFACVIRTQQIYAKALATGVMDFSYFNDDTFTDKHTLQTHAALTNAFTASKQQWQAALETASGVDWDGTLVSVAGHIYRLISHERLHHGQLISYFTLSGYELPIEFKRNWAL